MGGRVILSAPRTKCTPSLRVSRGTGRARKSKNRKPISNDKEERIRVEAWMLWNADGRPEGKADQYWFEAEKAIEHQDRLLKEEERRGEA